jgi:TATA-box binding protein (TBP) (component of TFIID and TFIIIB)
MFFSNFKVSTITCNADIQKSYLQQTGEEVQKINCKFDLELMFEKTMIQSISELNLNPEEKDFCWMYYDNSKEESPRTKGEYPKKKKRTGIMKKQPEKKRKFDNQITMIFKLRENYMPNIKVFQNGNVQMTGLKEFEDAHLVLQKLTSNIREIFSENPNILVNTGENEQIQSIDYQNFVVRLINTDFRCYTDAELTKQFHIKRKALHNLLIEKQTVIERKDVNENFHGNEIVRNSTGIYKSIVSSFNPGCYPGVKIEYYWNQNKQHQNGLCECNEMCIGKHNNQAWKCKKITIAVFESGSIIVTGSVSFEQVKSARDYICNFLNAHSQLIEKQQVH